MNTERNWEKPVRRLEQLMRLKSFPVAFKLFEDKEEIDRIPFMRRLSHKSTLCQLLNLARNFDWTVGADIDAFFNQACPTIIGLAETTPYMKDGTFRSIIWTKNREDGKRYENAIPRIPYGKYNAVAIAPLVYNPFDPDIVLIYANPAQMMLLINALQFEDYEVMNFYCVGESSCADAIARCYLNKKPSLTIPCHGERRYGHVQDDELVMAIPTNMMDKALSGMEALYKRGVRYPVSYAGAEADVSSTLPAAYSAEEIIKVVRGDNQRLLVGVTGSIATGKSVVADMLEALGAKMIDFDELSRIVVEPDKPAWQDIVGYFGKQVLNEDQTLDREKMREIVFQDTEKRKKLESFIHPRIGEEFFKLIEQYSHEDENVIIIAVIPLLIETNMQALFDNVLMVYAPFEIQLKRLMARDGNSEDLSLKIISTQMSVEDKKGYCDLFIDNSHSLEETRFQVETLWGKLKELGREKQKNIP